MPGLTIATDVGSLRSGADATPPPQGVARNNATAVTPPPPAAGSSSPPRPPVSPITPTLPANLAHLAPTSTGSGTYYIPNFAANRPDLTFEGGAPHDASATAVPPRRPEPIDFDSNPDVLALQSTISILQLQRQKALADMQKLKQAKEAALADPAAFMGDLQEGRIRKQPDLLFGGSSDSGDDDDADGKDDEAVAEKSKRGDEADRRPWRNLPQPQNIARMPPVNFNKYGIVGETLDKIHNEQLSRPPHGSLAAIATDGTFELKTGQAAADGKEYLGPAAPYNPLKDKLDKKPRGPKR